MGNQVRIAYDSSRRVTSLVYVTDPATDSGPTVSFSYAPGSAASPASGQTTLTDPRGKVTTYGWDSSDRVTRVTDALSHARDTTYSPNGDPATLTNAMSAVTTLGYDNRNNATSALAPASGSGASGAQSTARYATPATGVGGCSANCVAGGQYLASSATDPQGACQSHVYDAAGNLSDTYPVLAHNLIRWTATSASPQHRSPHRRPNRSQPAHRGPRAPRQPGRSMTLRGPLD